MHVLSDVQSDRLEVLELPVILPATASSLTCVCTAVLRAIMVTSGRFTSLHKPGPWLKGCCESTATGGVRCT